MSHAVDSPDGPPSREPLPPVEPPSAGFIVQLFVVPAILVAVIVVVFLLFSQLAQQRVRPEDYLRDLAGGRNNRWQVAYNLSHELRDDRNPLRDNAAFARSLAAMLEAEIEAGASKTTSEQVQLRMYLCHALGEFRVADGLGVLIRAASASRSAEEQDVRLAAIEAIAALNYNVKSGPLDNPRLLSVLVEASRDDATEVRQRAAFALGVIGGDEALARLRPMLADADADVRYNAATGMARHGDEACIEVLIEMLDPDEIDLSKERREYHDLKRSIVLGNALRATQKLAEANAQVDMRLLVVVLEELGRDGPSQEARLAARKVLYTIEKR